MAIGHKASPVYAKTLFEAATEKGVASEVLKDMQLIEEVLRNTQGVVAFLKNPIVSREKKIEILNSTFEGKLQDLTFKFFALLQKKDRLEIVGEIAEHYRGLEEKSRGILRAKVSSAVSLEKQQLEDIQSKLQQAYPGRNFLIEQEVDPDLLGGFRIFIGDTIIDHSIKNKLSLLRRKLVA